MEQKLENQKRNRVITLGTFDLLHTGHLRLFKKCRQLGDYVIGFNPLIGL
jgi:cytidyltransferase-like protein